MTLQCGRLLIKEELRLAQERIAISQNAAFQTAMQYARNAEQKSILGEWENTGSGVFKKKRADQIAQTTAEIAGINPEEIRGLGENRRRPEESSRRGEKKPTNRRKGDGIIE